MAKRFFVNIKRLAFLKNRIKSIFSTRKRIVIASCLAAGFLLLLIPSLIVVNLINSTRDYESVLSVQGKKADSVTGEVYTPRETPSATSQADVLQDQKEQDWKLLWQGGQSGPASRKSNSINLLFLGLDRTKERDKTLEVYRTDTIALASIDMDVKKVEVLNIPRDSYVYIPCIGKKDKINHAYVWGGMGKKGITGTIDAVNRFLKYSTVDYYFCIDMEPIPRIVDDVGGVELDVEIDMKDHGANLSKGRQLLDGKKAFDYIHWRYSAMGDIDRIKRQQKFAKAMVQKLKETNQLLNGVSIVLNYNQYIKTNMTVQQMIALARLMKDIPQGSTTFYEIKGAPRMIDKVWYWIPDETKTDELLRKIYKE